MGESGLIGEIVTIVRARTGVDFLNYREPTLERRILNRMATLGIGELEHYLRLLERSEVEADRLLERITIKVSRFYRHRPTFDLLREQVIPRLALLERPIRVWSAGCGCGEEAYTLAMLLDEAGLEGSVEATDVDAFALDCAREAHYAEEAADELPAALRERYLEPVRHARRARRRVCAELKARVRFSRSDLLEPGALPALAPFDLVCCRNVLIYWLPQAQSRLVANLRAALAPGGYLCLGEAEWPPPCAEAGLQPLVVNGRVFRAAGAQA